VGASVHNMELANLRRHNSTASAIVCSEPSLPNDLAIFNLASGSVWCRRQTTCSCNTSGRNGIATLTVKLKIGIIYGKHEGQRAQWLQIGKALAKSQEEGWSGTVVDVGDVIPRRPLQHRVPFWHRFMCRWRQRKNASQRVAFA